MKQKACRAFLLVLLLVIGSMPGTSRASEQEKEQAESNIEEYQKQIQEARQLLESLKDRQSDLSAYLSELNAAVSDKQEQIDSLQQRVAEKEAQLSEVEESLADAQGQSQKQYENMKLRIQYMYEAGTDDYLNLLFSAQSLNELLSSSEYISQMTEYDRSMLEEYRQTLVQIEQYQADLENGKEELNTLLTQAEADRAALDVLVQAQNEQLQQIAQQISRTQGDIEKSQEDLANEEELLAYLEAELERQAQEALRQAQLQAEQAAREASIAASKEEASRLAQEQAEQTKPGNSGTAGSTESTGSTASTEPSGAENPEVLATLTWPLPSSHRITSYFGPRPNKPVEGVASYHYGIDIAAPEGSDIVAAADGVIYYAGDGSEMGTTAGGNQIWIIHENGLYITSYMHCCALYVQEGQTVRAGDVIAGVGSTGLSTGNHLDFRICYQGTFLDPLGSQIAYR